MHRGSASILVLALCAACLPFAARAVAGEPGARIHVRWQPSIDESARHTLERQFRLDSLERLDDLTWRYDLIDTSTENIRALVGHPAVADTHEIDRPTYTIAPFALRTNRRERFAYGSGMVRAADLFSIALAAVAALLTLVKLTHTVPALQSLRVGFARVAGRTAPALRRGARAAEGITYVVSRVLAPGIRFVQRGVPELDARTAGLFRIVFGVTTLTYFAFPTHRVDASWLSNTFDSEVQGALHEWMMARFRAHPAVVELITPWLILTGVAFVVGIATRLTYTLFVAGALLWAYVAISVESTHPHSVLVLTLVALLPARWGDAFSVDNWWRRRRGHASADGVAAKRYGYAVWVPMLTLGIGFAAAAWAKLTVPPGLTSWVLNGAIKYHIISDSASAPVAWGIQLVRHPLLAVLVSFGAIAIEALVVTAAFVRDERYRLAMGVAAAALFAGIGMFMGIVWPGWWIPLLAFLPWERWSQALARPKAAPNAQRLTSEWLSFAQLIVVAGIVGQQVVASTLRLERAPMFSWYDMYARSYSGPEDYNASIPPTYRIFVTSDHGRRELHCSPHEELVRDFEAAVAGVAESKARVLRAIRGCGADLGSARYVTMEGNARTFDWERLRFMVSYPVSLGPLAAP